MVDVRLADNGEVLPPKTNKIALIDADTLIYAVMSSNEQEVELLPREYYTDDEWDDLQSSYEISEDGIYYTNNIDKCYSDIKERIAQLIDKMGCSDYELHLTGGKKSSFRYDLYDMYKATRTGRSPARLYEIKLLIAANDPKAFIWDKWEADDIVVAKKRIYPDKYILASVDKDVLYALPGKHYNYYQSQKYNIGMKWVKVDRLDAMKHHYLQTLIGDSSDNIPGIKGIGKKRAATILNGATTHKEMWDRVVEAYEKAGLTVIDAILTMRLVNMHQLQLVNNKWEIVLWQPPT